MAAFHTTYLSNKECMYVVMANGACLVVVLAMLQFGKSGTLIFVRFPWVSFFLLLHVFVVSGNIILSKLEGTGGA